MHQRSPELLDGKLCSPYAVSLMRSAGTAILRDTTIFPRGPSDVVPASPDREQPPWAIRAPCNAADRGISVGSSGYGSGHSKYKR
jgi:hypothetical protein